MLIPNPKLSLPPFPLSIQACLSKVKLEDGFNFKRRNRVVIFQNEVEKKIFPSKKVLNGPALDYAGGFQEMSLPQVFE